MHIVDWATNFIGVFNPNLELPPSRFQPLHPAEATGGAVKSVGYIQTRQTRSWIRLSPEHCGLLNKKAAMRQGDPHMTAQVHAAT